MKKLEKSTESPTEKSENSQVSPRQKTPTAKRRQLHGMIQLRLVTPGARRRQALRCFCIEID